MILQRIARNLFFFLVLFISSCLPALSQSNTFEERIFTNDSINIIAPREKIFIHHDKPYYNLKDTVWLKGYIVSASSNESNDSSRLAYVEIINAQNELVKRVVVPCGQGLFAGNIVLREKDFGQGEYRLRAWTRYMLNFGDSLFFEDRFIVIDPHSEKWKTTVRTLSFDSSRLVLSAVLKSQNSLGIANRPVSLRLLSNKRIIFRTRILTDPYGNIYIDTLLKNEDHKNLQLEIADRDNLQLQLPVKANGNRLVDLQFLPEGGAFIAGKLQRLGFKALAVSGKGIAVRGVIKDSKGKEIAKFESIHKGMGIVSFTPLATETYTAFPENGPPVILPLPQLSGIMLQLINQPGNDSIRLKIEASPDLYGKTLYFTASSKGMIAARGRITVTAKGFELNLYRKQFLPGITVFTIYNENLQPINERAFFSWYNNELDLSLITNKKDYLKKDSVGLRLQAHNRSGEPVVGSFSMAVLDTSQVKLVPDAGNLLSYMILSSDLKGEIEEPYYYFKNPNPDAIEALLLTQGWVSYNRKATPTTFGYENGFVIGGRVTNVFNKPVNVSRVTLFGKAGKDQGFVADTLTDKEGRFFFNDLPVYETDSISMVFKALNKNGKSFNVGIELNEPSYPDVKATEGRYVPGGIFADTIAQQYIANQEKIKAALQKGGVYLPEVIVTSRRRVRGSKNLNEDGGADQVIDEETLDKMPKESLLTILEKQVKGFHLTIPPRKKNLFYQVNTNIVRLIIDGTDLYFFFQPTGQINEYARFLESYMKYFSGEDIVGIEVMNTTRYNAKYRNTYLTLSEQLESGPATVDFTFIEITTRTGEGPFMKKIPGIFLLKPLYPSLAREFYGPKYSSPSQEMIFPDLRSTVYWNPYVMTNKAGEANLSFYTSESNGGYLIIVQGTDLSGNFGVLYQPMEIRNDKK